MRAEFLDGQTVVDREASIVGEISGLELNLKTWQIIGLWIQLDDDSIPTLGYKKPRFRGKVEVYLPTYTVQAVKDVVSLNKNHEEIKELLHRTNTNTS